MNRPLVVISLDGLASAALGCYGSSWNQTPAIDAIASGGCVWDRWIAETDDGISLLKQLLEAPSPDWTAPWREWGSVELLTDAPALIEAPERLCFDRMEALQFDPPTPDEAAAVEIIETQLGRLIAAGVDRGTQDDAWSVLWLHSAFLTQRWDAPRRLFPLDEEDEDTGEPSDEVELLPTEFDDEEELERIPPIFGSVIPPSIELDQQAHPDLATSWMRTYGCQIILLDLLVELLLESLAERNPILMLLGTSGFRLGQGGSVAHRPATLRSTELRLPLIIGDHGPLRVPQLEPSGRLGQLLETLGSESPHSIGSAERWNLADGDIKIETSSQRADYSVTTPNWFFVRDNDGEEHLYLKPDDIEDFNDISRLRRDVVDQLGERNK